MNEKPLGKSAGDAVSVPQISDGEDPTTCMQMLLSSLEAKEEKSPHLLKKIVSRIDSSFFAALRKEKQIAASSSFITLVR